MACKLKIRLLMYLMIKKHCLLAFITASHLIQTAKEQKSKISCFKTDPLGGLKGVNTYLFRRRWFIQKPPTYGYRRRLNISVIYCDLGYK